MAYQGFTAEDGKYEVLLEVTGQVCTMDSAFLNRYHRVLFEGAYLNVRFTQTLMIIFYFQESVMYPNY